MKRLLLALLFPLAALAQNTTINGAPNQTISITSPTTNVVNVPAFEYMNSITPAVTQFRQMLQYASTQPVNILIFSDSYGICDFTNCGIGPNVSTNRWPEQLRLALQSKYGSHGTGMVPLQQGANVINSEAWTVTGTSDFSTGSLGPTQTSMNALVHLGNGAVATFNDSRKIPWDTLLVYCMTNSGSGSLAVSIDGGGATNVCNTTTGSPTAHVVSVATGAGPTLHTVTLTSTGDSYLYAVEGTSGTQGVSVHNIATGTANSNFFGSAPTTQEAFSDLIPSGQQLAIISSMYNDQNAPVSTGTYTTNFNNLITHEQALSSTPSVMLLIPPVSSLNTTPATGYTQAVLGICAANTTVICANMQDHSITVDSKSIGWGGTSYVSSSLWDEVHSPGTHPSDQGQLDIAAIVEAQLGVPSQLGIVNPGLVTLYPLNLSGTITFDPYGYASALFTGNATVTLSPPHIGLPTNASERIVFNNFGTNTVTITGLNSTNFLFTSPGTTYCPSGCTATSYTIPANHSVMIQSYVQSLWVVMYNVPNQ